jgi:hypothetical protein
MEFIAYLERRGNPEGTPSQISGKIGSFPEDYGYIIPECSVNKNKRHVFTLLFQNLPPNLYCSFSVRIPVRLQIECVARICSLGSSFRQTEEFKMGRKNASRLSIFFVRQVFNVPLHMKIRRTALTRKTVIEYVFTTC